MKANYADVKNVNKNVCGTLNTLLKSLKHAYMYGTEFRDELEVYRFASLMFFCYSGVIDYVASFLQLQLSFQSGTRL